MKIKITVNKEHALFSQKCAANDLDAVRGMIADGFNLSDIWTCDEYPLSIAVFSNNVALARLLAESGMPLYLNTVSNHRDSQSEEEVKGTLVFGFVEDDGSNLDVCLALLDYASDVNTSGSSNPLLNAADVGDKFGGEALGAYVGKLFLLGADVDFPDGLGGTQLHNMVLGKNTAVVQHLISRTKDIDNPGKHGKGDMTPLSYAACHGHLVSVEALARNGANVNFCSSSAKVSILDFLIRYRDNNGFYNRHGEIDVVIEKLRELGAKTYVELKAKKK
jgi:ankyrin repeat protein